MTVSKELNQGKYLVTIVRSSANSNATANTTNADEGYIGNISGYDSIEHLIYTNSIIYKKC